MIRGIFFDVRALVYGPAGPELLSEVLKAEEVQAEPAEVAAALERLPRELLAYRNAMRTEEEENDYYRAMLPELLANLGVRFPTDAMLLRLVEAAHEYHAYFSLYPETLAVLEELRQRGVTMAVVAEWEPSLARFLQEFGLDHYISTAVASSVEGAAKSDPFLFRRALTRTGFAPQEVLHVGPSLSDDVTPATLAGIRPVWLNRTGIPTGHEVLTITDLRGLLLLAQKAGE